MTIDKMKRRFNVPDEWPIGSWEHIDDWTDRLCARGTERGVYRQCSIGWHKECSVRQIVGEACPCRCICHTPTSKRFTDAELAAEYYKAKADHEKTKFNEVSSGDEFTDERWAMVEEPLNTLHRFATLPHYDEATS